MRKVTLTDNSGRWFDVDAARRWDEAAIMADDGTPISRATGNSWEHEALFLTTKGTFIIHCYNDRNRSLDSFAEYDPKEAVKWLLANGYFHCAT
jgi:hypothetical protein